MLVNLISKHTKSESINDTGSRSWYTNFRALDFFTSDWSKCKKKRFTEKQETKNT